MSDLARARTRAMQALLARMFKVDERTVWRRLMDHGIPTFDALMERVERNGARLAQKISLEEANARALVKALAEAMGGKEYLVAKALYEQDARDWHDFSNATLLAAEQIYEAEEGVRPMEAVRPAAARLVEYVAMDLQPDSPEVLTAFWIIDQPHWEALYYPVEAGDITVTDLDRILGNPKAITEAVNRSPSNPHKGIVFGAAPPPPPFGEVVLGAKRRGGRPVRPVVQRLLEAVAFDVYPDSPAVLVDFEISDQLHYEALYYPIKAGEITPEDLDRVLGDPEAITELVNKAPSNPHKGIVFGWNPGRGGGALGIADVRPTYAQELLDEGLPGVRTDVERREAFQKWGLPNRVCREGISLFTAIFQRDHPDCATVYVDDDQDGKWMAVDVRHLELHGKTPR
jgi:hypothetical protein